MDWATNGIVLIVLLKAQLGPRVQAWALQRIGRPWLRPPVCAAALVAVFQVLRLPAVLISAWLWPAGVGVAASAGAAVAAIPWQALGGTAALWLLLWIAGASPRWGWAWIGGALGALLFALVLLPPVTLTPDARHDVAVSGPSARPLLAFARRGGLQADQLHVFDSADPMAVDMEGLGPIKQASVSRAALASPRPETYAAAGHLLGHYAHKDLWSMAFLETGLETGLLFLFWRCSTPLARRLGEPGLTPPADPAGLPILGLIAWAFVLAAVPAFNVFDQAINYRADAYAMRLTHDPDGLCRWLIAAEASSKADPSGLEALFFYDHPPLKARLIQAMRWKAAHPAP